MVCFNQFTTRVLNNGHMTQYMKITRGNKQGCPISSLIFNLVAEIIPTKLRQDSKIDPIKIGMSSKVASQYADELWTVMKYNTSSFNRQWKLFDQFEAYTGLAINYNKTEILRIGSISNTKAELYTTRQLKWSDGPIKVLGLLVTSDGKHDAKLNYLDVIEKIMIIMRKWSKRLLTLMGKIQVINSLIISNFIMKMQCLESPTPAIIKRYKTEVQNFLWSNKKPKISYDKLIQLQSNGGLRLEDLESRDKSIKIAMVKNLLDHKDKDIFLNVAFKYFLDIPLDLLPKINLRPSDSVRYAHTSIVKDLLKIWCVYTFCLPMNKDQVLAQAVWLNSHVKINMNPIFWKRYWEQGIVRIQDFFDDATQQWLSIKDFATKYGINVNFLDYLTITRNFPKDWLCLMMIKGTGKRVTAIEETINNPKVTKIVYESFIGRMNVLFKARYKWEQMLDIGILDCKWQKLLTDIYKITNCTKLHWFQYRQLNHLIYTNVFLARWSNVNSKCYYCKKEEETVLHLFVQCKYVQRTIWRPLMKWLYYFCNIDFVPEADVIIPLNYKDSFPNMVNTIILIAKQYIFSTRCLEKVMNFTTLVTKISTYKKLEELSAQKRNNLKVHNAKWLMYDLL